MKIVYSGLVAVAAGLAISFAVQSCKPSDNPKTETPDSPTVIPTAIPTVQPTNLPSSSLPEVTEDRRVAVREDKILNLEATIPPQCYTKTEGRFNPCYTCHQLYDRQHPRFNQLDDGALQGDYGFSDVGVSNHWSNLFEDRSEWLATISDAAITEYVSTENYTDLPARLESLNWQGFSPDLRDYPLGAAAFDERGLAKDGSYWVAFNYKPFPGTFWPTNGATDDVVIRLPKLFRELNGEFNADVYYTNLTLIEISLKDLEQASIWPINEQDLGADIDNNGVMETATQVNSRSYYVGDASSVPVTFQQFPEGTEFMHSVRYLGVDNQGGIYIPPRMKELRYMRKVTVLDQNSIESRYANERKEKRLENLPSFVNRQHEGFDNGMGWYVQGFIEDYDGELRPQSFEERTFCMGCHSAIGTTIDNTFSYARKVTGAAGWKYIDLHDMADAPSISEQGGEILRYLQRSGGGNEFRQNPEMLAKWYNEDGTVKEDSVQSADVYSLLAPSPERAQMLNKAYTQIVRHQSYIFGRDATWVPSENIFNEINEEIPPLELEYRYYGWDIRLDWSE